jgi:hypothetical protein
LSAIGVSVATSLATGVAQRLVGADPSASRPSAVPESPSPLRGKALIAARAHVVEDFDQDIWVAGRSIDLTSIRSAQINADRVKGAEQGDLSPYLRDMTVLGAVKANGLALDLDLSTPLDEQVRINRIRADFRCRAPLAGSLFYSQLAGPAVPIGKIGFDLDSPVPVARKLVEHEGEQTFGGDFFANNVQYVKKDDGTAYRVVVRSTKRYCEFQLMIDASAGGSSQTVWVGDQGGPFRVSGLICTSTVSCPRFSAYGRVYVGGAANVAGHGAWTAKNPRTYQGG